MSVARDRSFWVSPPKPSGNVRPVVQQPPQRRSERQGPPSLFGPPSAQLDHRATATGQHQEPAGDAPGAPDPSNATSPREQAPPFAPNALSESADARYHTPGPQPGWTMAAPSPSSGQALGPPAVRGDVFVRWAVLGLGFALLAAFVAFLATSLFLTPVFESTTTTIVRSTPVSPFQPRSDDLDIFEGFLAGEELAPTFRQLALRPSVLSAASATTGTPMEQIRGSVEIRTIPRTPLIVVAYRDPSPARAALHADAVAQAMVAVSTRDQWVPERELAVIDAAQIQRSPVAPNPTLNALIAFVAIATLVGGLGFAIESNRRYSNH